eukprot:4760877-Alexandrium_andersonii.AAC.1
MQNCFKRSEPEQSGPRNGLKSSPRSSRGADSAQPPAQKPNQPTNTWGSMGGPRSRHRETST